VVGPEGKVYAVDKERGASNIDLILAADNDPRLPESGVDLIFTCNTYHHLTDRVAYLRSLQRHLRPGGRIAVIDYSRQGWFSRLFGHGTTKETVRSEMEAAGYRLTDDFDFLTGQHFQVFRVG
jgi:ubiquinone/menaquinone biosynthesis C-methylase UbiE